MIRVDNTKLMDIIAYYLSEYDMRAVEMLGYTSRSEAFQLIGQLFGKNNNYLKRLRDEYDVVTSSTRNGQRNRPPRERIIKTALQMKTFSFDEITDIVMSIINNVSNDLPDDLPSKDIPDYNISSLSEEEIESIINFKDNTAGIKIITSQISQRIYSTGIIKQLKTLYKGHCQLCGHYPLKEYTTNICEVHHIEYFADSQNNNASNLIVVCPNHHRLIHKLNPAYNKEQQCFVFSDGSKLEIKLNYHL